MRPPLLLVLVAALVGVAAGGGPASNLSIVASPGATTSLDGLDLGLVEPGSTALGAAWIRLEAPPGTREIRLVFSDLAQANASLPANQTHVLLYGDGSTQNETTLLGLAIGSQVADKHGEVRFTGLFGGLYFAKARYEPTQAAGATNGIAPRGDYAGTVRADMVAGTVYYLHQGTALPKGSEPPGADAHLQLKTHQTGPPQFLDMDNETDHVVFFEKKEHAPLAFATGDWSFAFLVDATSSTAANETVTVRIGHLNETGNATTGGLATVALGGPGSHILRGRVAVPAFTIPADGRLFVEVLYAPTPGGTLSLGTDKVLGLSAITPP